MLVEVYEEKELNLAMEDAYKEKKYTLLNKRKVSHLDFQEFVSSTTDSAYTQFNYYLILDLRNNSGGQLDACLRIARHLLPRCDMLLLNYKEKQVIHRKINSEDYSFKKIFILVNHHTASCSEILTLMLVQKLQNVYLIGEETVKKTVTLHSITNIKYHYQFSITDARWYVDNDDVHHYQSTIIPVARDGYMSQILKIIEGDD